MRTYLGTTALSGVRCLSHSVGAFVSVSVEPVVVCVAVHYEALAMVLTLSRWSMFPNVRQESVVEMLQICNVVNQSCSVTKTVVLVYVLRTVRGRSKQI